MTAPASTPARASAASRARRRDAIQAPGSDSVSSRGRGSAPGRDSGSSRGGQLRGGPSRGRSPAVARAYARRAQRAGAARDSAQAGDANRTGFVMLVMALLGTALVATLWLSTAATADSYHLQSALKDERNLTERSESLGRQVATLETAPELARRARELGMVPAGDAARLVVRPDGGVTLIGQPRRATAPAPPPVLAAPAVGPGQQVPAVGPVQPPAPAVGPLPPALPPGTAAPVAPAAPPAQPVVIPPAATPSGRP